MSAIVLDTDSLRNLKRELRVAERQKRLRAAVLIAPLAIFLLLTFVIPIGVLLKRAVENPEVVTALPSTIVALKDWDQTSVPSAPVYAALVADLTAAKSNDSAGQLARRLNNEISGFRSLVMQTTRKMPLAEGAAALTPNEAMQQLIAMDPRWGDPKYWVVIASNGNRYSPYYLLSALDLKQTADGSIEKVDENKAIFLPIFARTFSISAIVTLCSLLLAYPVAYWMSKLPPRRANLCMILVLIPFWTSVLVRIAAWIVLLQSGGLVNKALMSLGWITEPMELLFNRVGVYIAMVHILLPFMILPLYSVMKSIPLSYTRAAVSLGSHPFAAFWRVYVPQTYPGVGAGALLVFILAIGYYITPALLGGPNEQMVSYYVAYFTNHTINWGMACALGGLLLFATLALYAVYRRFAKLETGLG
ncbi:MAG: ABC transporter permease [Gammaproteobacteria bacterium]|nr:ABC transporter permease [Gammaproteobacteria bacterium]